MNKRNEMKALIEINQPDIVGITEVKPKHARFNVQECEIAIEGYELFHNLEEEGRGIALLVRKEMEPTPNDRLSSTFSEHVFVDCTQGDGTLLTVGVIYRRPGSTSENDEKLFELIRNTAGMRKDNLLIFGDFNLPSINWDTESCRNNESHEASQFLQAYTDACLFQHQKETTRFREGEKPSVVDLVLTNKEDMIKDISTEAGLGKSDHFCLFITLNAKTAETAQSARFCYSRTDESVLKDILQNVKWEKELKDLSANLAWEKIKEKIYEAIGASTPMARPSGRQRKPWMNRETLASVRKKHQLFRRWLATRNAQDYANYLKARNEARKACRKAQKNMEMKLASEAKTNPNGVWKYAKSKISCKSGIPDLKKEDGSRTKTDAEKAELLNIFFKSVFTTEDSGPVPEVPEYDFKESRDDVLITADGVRQLLAGLQPGKAAGPDGLPPRILSVAANELAVPLTHLFRLTLDTGELPSEWKMAYVSPIFKKGSRMSPNNYRPVSLTCVVCKVMEKLVRKVLMDHLEENDIVTREQHGFVSGRSCITHLLEVMDSWTEVVDEGGSVDVIYTDFQKAFDSVPHRRLMRKVSACGIGGKLFRWINEFLANRTQRVVINGEKSQEGNVTSGIPQGSVLGPILFVIYINDLPANVKSQVKMFADDTKLFTRVDVPNNHETMQNDLDELVQWSNKWQLKFHPEKCGVLKLGRERETEYFMNSKDKDGNPIRVKLKEVQAEKDLGVTIDKVLSFKRHVELATSKANRVIGVIRRSFDYLTPAIFVQLFKGLVRPLLEYGHCVWNPDEKNQKGLCAEVEKVQRRATKMLGHLKNLPYPERLRWLKLPCLEHRRKRGDVIEVYKYLHGFYKVSRPDFHIARNVMRSTRGNFLKLLKPRHRLNVRGNYFANRVVNLWNSLPDNVVTAPSVDSFKRRLDKHWAALPSMYDPECLA